MRQLINVRVIGLAAILLIAGLGVQGQGASNINSPAARSNDGVVKYSTIKVDGLNIAYREAGNASSPKIVLLRGFPAASHQ